MNPFSTNYGEIMPTQVMAKVYVIHLHRDSDVKTLYCIYKRKLGDGHQLYDPWNNISFGVENLEPVSYRRELLYHAGSGQFRLRLV